MNYNYACFKPTQEFKKTNPYFRRCLYVTQLPGSVRNLTVRLSAAIQYLTCYQRRNSRKINQIKSNSDCISKRFFFRVQKLKVQKLNVDIVYLSSSVPGLKSNNI